LFALYEAVIEEHAVVDPLAESRAAAAFLQQLAVQVRNRDGRIWSLANASQRALETPVIGPIATRILRRLLRPRR
jgi:hypothetical protein